MENNQKRKKIEEPKKRRGYGEVKNPYEEEGKEYIIKSNSTFNKQGNINKDSNANGGSVVIKGNIKR